MSRHAERGRGRRQDGVFVVDADLLIPLAVDDVFADATFMCSSTMGDGATGIIWRIGCTMERLDEGRNGNRESSGFDEVVAVVVAVAVPNINGDRRDKRLSVSSR